MVVVSVKLPNVFGGVSFVNLALSVPHVIGGTPSVPNGTVSFDPGRGSRGLFLEVETVELGSSFRPLSADEYTFQQPPQSLSAFLVLHLTSSCGVGIPYGVLCWENLLISVARVASACGGA
jgi:hypothetical protein